jgi:hypothetical protein
MPLNLLFLQGTHLQHDAILYALTKYEVEDQRTINRTNCTIDDNITDLRLSNRRRGLLLDGVYYSSGVCGIYR